MSPLRRWARRCWTHVGTMPRWTPILGATSDEESPAARSRISFPAARGRRHGGATAASAPRSPALRATLGQDEVLPRAI